MHFADPEGFTFMPLLLDVSGVEMQFRIVQQGYTGTGLCNSLSMRYGSPKLDHPSHCIEVEQRDLEIWPESGVGRPAAILGVNKRSEG